MKTLTNIKKTLPILFVLMLTLIFPSCKKDEPLPTELIINISQQPVGGSYVSSVSVNIQGGITGTVKPIGVSVEWWWENGSHTDQRLMESTEFIFNSDNSTSKSSVYRAPEDYILLNYYWVKISWTDDNGPHVLESSKAYCGD